MKILRTNIGGKNYWGRYLYQTPTLYVADWYENSALIGVVFQLGVPKEKVSL